MKDTLPVMLLKGLVLLPHQEVKLDINNKISRKLVMLSSQNYDNEIMIVCPKDQKEEMPEVSDLPNVGVICKITSKIELPNGHLKIKVVGIKRVAIDLYTNSKDDKNLLECKYSTIIIPKFNEVEETAVRRKLIEVLKKYISMRPDVSNSILSRIKDEKSLYKLTDQITLFIPLSIEKKLDYMEEINAIKRAHKLIKDLNIEIEIALLDDKIDCELAADLENTQKEFILKEKIKQIKKELGDEDLKDKEVCNYLEKLNELKISEDIKDKIRYEIKKYEMTSEMSPDSSLIRTYIDWIIDLPWNIVSQDETDLTKIKKKLDKSHFGLEELKDRIIEYVAVKKRNENIKSPIICLVGPPGVGKTTFAYSIANALDKKFAKISVGGLNDSAELVGHRRTYLGSAPGKIIESIKKCKTSNPLILIDEVDKMVKDYKGDPASTLLDILDFEQNKDFTDNYIGEPFDLSKVFFILTANNKDNIPVELLDRLEIIELSSYTDFDKLDISKKYLIPRIFKEHSVTNKEIKITDDALKSIISNYTKESGVRELERIIETLTRKVIVENSEEIKINIKSGDLNHYLGQEKYDVDKIDFKVKPGTINGLAYTPTGGLSLRIESVMYDGDGKVISTGSLGDVLKESITVAMSYIQANKDEFRVSDYFFKSKNIHIHALDGAVKKDGPSAGIAITTSLLSLLLDKKVNHKIAMTGEISLSGDILEIGGLKEKLIGAYNSGIEIVFIPKKNHKDLTKVPKNVLNKLTIIEVSNYIEVYNNIFG